MNDKTDAAVLAELLRDPIPTALLWRADDDLSAALLDLAEEACQLGAPRPRVVAVGGVPDGEWDIVQVHDVDTDGILSEAAAGRLLCARPGDKAGATPLPAALLSALVRRAKSRLPEATEADALFDRMKMLGYL